LWQFYIQLVEIEATFKTMEDDLNLRESRARQACRRADARCAFPYD
jgi:hypothetical protein